ncbi:NfeD family protein [Pelomonas sp. SE-A7]|uniref:NfeD family protein n=1 Tax=Pelomonas sp. SE-A7 TaxID=3054953 RepID=UPI00259D2F8A|nr:NfeD family protein [Pelomonas sp. SE-A7]MDM4765437.1 NfeD family protein [Pelomonas sp. SE-A7]
METTSNPAIAWWIIAGVLVAIELATGTFYLLMMALGAVAAALCAHLGLGFSAQLVAAAAVGGAAVAVWHSKRARSPREPAESNRDVNLDIGQTVDVGQWQADGSATVKYRGAEWQARFQGSGTPHSGRHVIRAVDGSCLLLDAA